jgi:Tol biopolymer transport system component
MTDLVNVGKAAVTVVNPSAGSSNAVSFTIAADTISFQSSRALDGSNAANANTTSNIWLVNPDGSGQIPLTKLTASGANSDSPRWSADGTKIMFRSLRALDGSNASNSGANIWVMNADGSGATALTKITNADSGEDGIWSPDSSRVAFDSDRALDGSDAKNGTNDTENVWVINGDGSGLMPLTKLTALAPGIPPEGSFMDTWSPDGSKITFDSERAFDGSNAFVATNNIWVMNPDGSGASPLTRLIASGPGSFVAAFSPDGSKIAFVSTRALDGSDSPNTNNTENLWVMNADGSNPIPLTKTTAALARVVDRSLPAWSPDGTKIAFSANLALDGSNAQNTNGVFNIWIVNVDGSGRAPLTKLTASGLLGCFDSLWSSDGSKIFFDSSRALDGSDASNTNNTSNIWIMNADGSAATPLTKLTAAGAGSSSPSLPF